jgi:hypothetical protein
LPDNPDAAQSRFMPEPIREPGRFALPHLAPLEFPNQTILQYVTICADKRRPLLAKPEIVALLLDCWRKADHWLVGRYVIMPDHLHLFLRTREIAGYAAETMGSVLAGGDNPPLAASGGKAGLATRFFRPAVAERRKLSSKVALSLGKSNQGWSGEATGRLAVSR